MDEHVKAIQAKAVEILKKSQMWQDATQEQDKLDKDVDIYANAPELKSFSESTEEASETISFIGSFLDDVEELAKELVKAFYEEEDEEAEDAKNAFLYKYDGSNEQMHKWVKECESAAKAAPAALLAEDVGDSTTQPDDPHGQNYEDSEYGPGC